jgi:4-hydroxybenzoate polyprenyltransferase
LSYIYFSLFCLLMIVYTFINIRQNKKIFYEKVFKLIFLLVVVFFGGILFLL